MKVLKLTFEIPLGKSTVDALRKSGELVGKFKADVKEAGLTLFAVEETVVSRPGRD